MRWESSPLFYFCSPKHFHWLICIIIKKKIGTQVLTPTFFFLGVMSDTEAGVCGGMCLYGSVHILQGRVRTLFSKIAFCYTHLWSLLIKNKINCTPSSQISHTFFPPVAKQNPGSIMEISKSIPDRVLRNKSGKHTYFEENSVFLLLPEPCSHRSYYRILMWADLKWNICT